MANKFTLKVNGGKHAVETSADTPLLFVLRNELHLHGPRFGCGLAQCGACTVLLGDQAIRSCVTPVAAVQGKNLTTLEGLGTEAQPHPLQTAFVKNQAAQCGYCSNAMIMGATSLMRLGAIKANTTDEKITSLMTPYLCRCGTHYRILAAIKDAAKAVAAGGKI
jgi:nicotinate dehydrogenase subunit A